MARSSSLHWQSRWRKSRSVRLAIENQAYAKYKDQIGATKEAYYTKLNRTEPAISEAIVQFSAIKANELMEQLRFQPWEVIPGYNAYSLDGNHLQKTEKRLAETRFLCAAPLRVLS